MSIHTSVNVSDFSTAKRLLVNNNNNNNNNNGFLYLPVHHYIYHKQTNTKIY